MHKHRAPKLIRVTEWQHEVLKKLSRMDNQSIAEVLDRLLLRDLQTEESMSGDQNL